MRQKSKNKMERIALEVPAEYAVSIESTEDDLGDDVGFKNPTKQLGFAQIEHIVALDINLSDGAYRTYSILHYFSHQKDYAYPSIEKLAQLRGKDEGTIRRHLEELRGKGLIRRSRRFGTSSMTYIEDLPKPYDDAATEILKARKSAKRAKMRGTDTRSAQKCAVEPRKNARKRITNEEEKEHDIVNMTNSNPPETPSVNPSDEYKKSIANAMAEYEKHRGKKRGVADPLADATDYERQLVVELMGVLVQQDIPLEQIPVPTKRDLKFRAMELRREVDAGRMSRTDVEKAIAYLRNSGGEKYRSDKFNVTSGTVLKDVCEFVSRSRDKPTEQVIHNPDGSLFV